MGKRNYTHVQAMRPEIKTMLAEGKIRQEVAEHYSFQDKQVVKKLLERERARQRKLEAGIIPRPKSRPRKPAIPGDVVLTQAYEIQRLPHHISSQRRVSSVRHVCILCSIQKLLLCFRLAPCQTLEGRGSCRTHRTAAGTQLPYLWLPANVVVAENSKHFP